MLQELVAYAERHLPDSEPGFRAREVRWLIELTEDGCFLNILPLGDGRKGETQPRCPEMHGMNAGGKAHFLIETAQTLALLLKTGEDPTRAATAQDRHGFFVDLLRQAAESVPVLVPVAELLNDPSRLTEVRLRLAATKCKPSDWVGWRIGGLDPQLDEKVQAWWREWRRQDLTRTAGGAARRVSGSSSGGGAMVCLLTGKPGTPLATHPKIVGLTGVGGLAMGDVVVGFDKPAFGSYGLDQSANAAMGSHAVQKYVDGLNDLINDHSYKLANALVVHWFKAAVPVEDDPLAFLHGFETEEQTEAVALSAVRRLLKSIRTGQRADLGTNRFYALTISGAAGRVMVRDWMEGSFEDLAKHIEAWFSDLAIVAREGRSHARDPKFMAVCGALVREFGDLPGPTVATLWRVAVQGLPIPRALLAQALARFRADVVDKDQPPLNHACMGLIKAYFIRRPQGGDSNMTADLNPDHPEPAYHCGRLLAILGNLQRAALGDVGAGVVQRYYAASSQTPGLMLGRLISNARNHLSKLDPGLAWWYEQRMAEVMSKVGDRAPRVLDLEGQGLFALGYYQQLATLRAGKPSETANEKGEAK